MSKPAWIIISTAERGMFRAIVDKADIFGRYDIPIKIQIEHLPNEEIVAELSVPTSRFIEATQALINEREEV